MTTNQAAKTESYTVEPGGGVPISGQGVRIKATTEQAGGQAAVLEVVNPGFGGPPLHVHHGHDEMYYVLEGEYLLQLGDEVITLAAGGFALAARGVPHTFASAGMVPGRLLIMAVPGGLEKFVQGLDRLMAEGADEDAIRQLGDAWDTELIGPPLSR